jgi:hypothetical protein
MPALWMMAGAFSTLDEGVLDGSTLSRPSRWQLVDFHDRDARGLAGLAASPYTPKSLRVRLTYHVQRLD